MYCFINIPLKVYLKPEYYLGLATSGELGFGTQTLAVIAGPTKQEWEILHPTADVHKRQGMLVTSLT